MTHHSAHSSWVLSHIIEIDRHRAGFCGEFFRASIERRQVIAAYLAAKPPAETEMAEVGHLLLGADHRSILARAYEEVPMGLRGALRRAGPAAHERRFYAIVHRLLATPPHPDVTQCIARIESLDLTKLLVIRILPEAICRANVVDAVASASRAKDVATGYRLLISRGVDGADLASAIQQVRNESELTKVWNTWLLKAKSPLHPVPANDGYFPVTSGAALSKLAQRYRNCARRYLTDVLDEQAGHAFAEVRHAGEGVVVHLAKEDDQWRLEGVFGPGNSRPSPAMREHVTSYLRSHHVKVGERERARRTEWDALRRLANAFHYAFEFD